MLKKILIILLNTVASIILIIFVFDYFMSMPSTIHKEISERIASPDMKVDALFVKSSGGVTAPIIYEVYIVPHAAKLDSEKDQASFTAEKMDNEKLFWSYPHQLNIQYDTAEVYGFTSFWSSSKVNNSKYSVNLVLLPAEICNTLHS